MEAILMLLISGNSFQTNSSFVPQIHCPAELRCIKYVPRKHVLISLLEEQFYVLREHPMIQTKTQQLGKTVTFCMLTPNTNKKQTCSNFYQSQVVDQGNLRKLKFDYQIWYLMFILLYSKYNYKMPEQEVQIDLVEALKICLITCSRMQVPYLQLYIMLVK